LFSDLLFLLFVVLVFFEFLLLLLEQLRFQGWQVRSDLHLDLVLCHVLKFLVLVVHWQSLGVVHVSQFVMLSPVVFLLIFLSFFVVSFHVFFKSFEFSEACVESVLDIVINSTWHEFLYLNPLVSKVLVEFHELQVLSHGPFLLVEVGVYVVIPSLSTLLADSSRQECGDLLPLLEAVLCDLLPENHVFFRRPVAFDLLDGAVPRVIPKVKPAIHAFQFALGLVE
jgi:hypothetical protein